MFPQICVCGHHAQEHHAPSWEADERCYHTKCPCKRFEPNKARFVMVLADNETWSDVAGCKMLMLSEGQYQMLLEGFKPHQVLHQRTLDISPGEPI